MSTKKYTVLRRLEHDNKPYEVGAEIELNDTAAADLLGVQAIETGVTAEPAAGAEAAADTKPAASEKAVAAASKNKSSSKK